MSIRPPLTQHPMSPNVQRSPTRARARESLSLVQSDLDDRVHAPARNLSAVYSGPRRRRAEAATALLSAVACQTRPYCSEHPRAKRAVRNWLTVRQPAIRQVENVPAVAAIP